MDLVRSCKTFFLVGFRVLSGMKNDTFRPQNRAISIVFICFHSFSIDFSAPLSTERTRTGTRASYWPSWPSCRSSCIRRPSRVPARTRQPSRCNSFLAPKSSRCQTQQTEEDGPMDLSHKALSHATGQLLVASLLCSYLIK